MEWIRNAVSRGGGYKLAEEEDAETPAIQARPGTASSSHKPSLSATFFLSQNAAVNSPNTSSHRVSMSLDQQKQLKRPSSPIRPRSYSLVSDQAHSRDIKCATCFDYAVIYEDSEVSQHFRRWYTSWQRGLHTSPTSFPTSTSVTVTVSTKGDAVTDPEGPSSSEGVGGYQKVLVCVLSFSGAIKKDRRIMLFCLNM